MQEQNPQKENIINLNLIVSVSEIGWNAWWVLQFGPLSQGPTCRAGLFFFFFSLSLLLHFFLFFLFFVLLFPFSFIKRGLNTQRMTHYLKLKSLDFK